MLGMLSIAQSFNYGDPPPQIGPQPKKHKKPTLYYKI